MCSSEASELGVTFAWPTTGRARSAAEAAGNPTLWQSSTTSARLEQANGNESGYRRRHRGLRSRARTSRIRRPVSRLMRVSEARRVCVALFVTLPLSPLSRRGARGDPRDEQLTAGRTAISPSVSGRASSSPVREMTRQTVGMYAGAKREQCDRSESELNTIGLEHGNGNAWATARRRCLAA